MTFKLSELRAHKPRKFTAVVLATACVAEAILLLCRPAIPPEWFGAASGLLLGFLAGSLVLNFGPSRELAFGIAVLAGFAAVTLYCLLISGNLPPEGQGFNPGVVLGLCACRLILPTILPKREP
jgi:peptidoglycan/LPS O-acetylase OafA/YrhL